MGHSRSTGTSVAVWRLDPSRRCGSFDGIGASRLQQISNILQVPVAFFFEGAPAIEGQLPDGMRDAPSPAYVSDFLATSEGLALTKAFMRIKEAKLRRRVVELVKEIAGVPEEEE